MTLYHLSAVPLGREAVLRPRVPRDRAPLENRTVPRVCVAPTIAGCLRAVRTCYYARGLWYCYVVVTEYLPDAMEPLRVPDAVLTGERWFLRPVEVRYAGTLRSAL